MTLFVVDSESEPARSILDAYGLEMKRRYGQNAPYGANHVAVGVKEVGGAFVVACDDHGNPVGCGAIRRFQGTTCEIKSMFVRHENRGGGIGRGLLTYLEELARSMGYEQCRLNTGKNQPEALHLYQSSGYVEIDRYNDNPLAAYWFAKSL